MGKSTTAEMFRKEGIPVWDADAAVHKMYAKGGSAVSLIRALYPQAVTEGFVDRASLKDWISKDPLALGQIEAVVHPLLSADRTVFLLALEVEIAVLDFPLLFETGAEHLVDLVVVVSVSPDVQEHRILKRNTMNKQILETILAAQMPDSEKRAKADIVIETTSLDATRNAVQKLLEDIRKGKFNA